MENTVRDECLSKDALHRLNSLYIKMLNIFFLNEFYTLNVFY